MLYLMRKMAVFLRYLAKQAFSPVVPIALSEVLNRSRIANLFQVFQPRQQNLPLKLRIGGVPHRMAQRKPHKQRPRWLYLLGDRSI